jgi:aspartyl-tRNA(Asn)/glutamyl-tRNA(Gln) amidotransferase subunit B
MEKGGMRLEANISLAPLSSRATEGSRGNLPNYKVELKNINSFRFLERGIEYEIERQKEILDKNNTPVQETRGYSAEKDVTYTQRTKEEAADYRYFPDPDIPPININDKWLGEIKSDIPEPMDSRFKKWQEKYSLKPESIELLFETSNEADCLDKLFEIIAEEKLSAEKFVNSLINKKIQVNLFKDRPEAIVEQYKKLTAVDDIKDEDLKIIIDKVLKANPSAVSDYKFGKTQSINFLVGAVMREAKKKIEFKKLLQLVELLLNKA